MNHELLQRWIRDELPPDERRAVTRWIVTCTAPELPALLSGMIRDHEDERADALLAARSPLLARLVGAFRAQLDAGLAALDGGGPALRAASTDAAAPAQPPAELRWKGDRQVLHVDVPGPQACVVFTDDDGAASRHDLADLPADVALPPLGARPTAWLLWGAALPEGADPLVALDAALADPLVQRFALRWTPEEDED